MSTDTPFHGGMPEPQPLVLGVRREDKSKWERRVPLTPEAVRAIVTMGVKVIVEPSTNRIFRDIEYELAGAQLGNLKECHIILGVKEVKLHLLLERKAYVFFSHVIKAQPAGMPLLDAVCNRHIRLFDYETVTRGGVRGGTRLIAFGRFAGIAGVIDFFSGCGARFLSLGHSTPFLNIGKTYSYPTLFKHAMTAVREAGEAVRQFGLPHELTPLTIAITGDGNVANGARAVIEALGPVVKWVRPDELEGIVANSRGKDRSHCIYATQCTAEHMVARVAAPAGCPFDKGHYKSTPEEYEPVFHTKVAPYLKLLAVCHYWEPRYPRLLTVQQTADLLARSSLRLLGITDISADFMGSVEFGREFRPIDSPFFLYNPVDDSVVHDMDTPRPAILYHCVDHLPSECAREASEHFSACLLPFIPALVSQKLDLPVEEDESLPLELRGAAIADGGRLTRNFEYIAILRAARERTEAAAARHSLERGHEGSPLPGQPSSSAGSPAGSRHGRFSPGPTPAPSGLHIGMPQRTPSSTHGGQAMARNASFLSLHVAGHVFDSGWVNAGLDACEGLDVDVAITAVSVGKDRDTPTRMSLVLASKAGQGQGQDALTQAVARLKVLAAAKSIHMSINTDEEQAAAQGASAVAAGVVSAAAASSIGLELEVTTEEGAEEDVTGVSGGARAQGVHSPMPRMLPPLMGLSPRAASVLTRHGSTPRGTPHATPLAFSHLHGPLQTSALARARGPLPPLQPKRVLLLGAGLVAGPALATLVRRPGIAVTVASVLGREAEELITRYGPAGAYLRKGAPAGLGSSARAIVLDASNDPTGLKSAVSVHDVVLSLLPATLHGAVARACVDARVHLVTASYVSPEVSALAQEASAAGVIFLNEMGLDPGIDHASAASLIHSIHTRGGTVTEFTSLCGGLPAPEAAMDNCLGYKFSWSPRGALVAMQNAATYMRQGKVVHVPGPSLLVCADRVRLGPAFALEVLPNRDSLPYADKYGIAGPALQCMFRGTLRYEGFSARMRIFGALGLLSPTPRALPQAAGDNASVERHVGANGRLDSLSLRSLSTHLLQLPTAGTDDDIADAVLSRMGAAGGSGDGTPSGEALPLARAEVLLVLRWAQLLDPSRLVHLVTSPSTPTEWLPVDTLAGHLTGLPAMQFRQGERDLTLLQHTVLASYPGGVQEEYTATLVAYGDASPELPVTAMARTVGTTAAIGVEILLEFGPALQSAGDVKGEAPAGLLSPTHPVVFGPTLRRLAEEGIHVQESSRLIG